MITEELINSIMGIISDNHFNRPNRKIHITNDVIDGFIEYLSKTDNVLDSLVIMSINMFNDANRVSADKEHVDKLVNLLNDVKSNICHKIDIVQKKYKNINRPLEEMTKEELIAYIKNKNKI